MPVISCFDFREHLVGVERIESFSVHAGECHRDTPREWSDKSRLLSLFLVFLGDWDDALVDLILEPFVRSISGLLLVGGVRCMSTAISHFCKFLGFSTFNVARALSTTTMEIACWARRPSMYESRGLCCIIFAELLLQLFVSFQLWHRKTFGF